MDDLFLKARLKFNISFNDLVKLAKLRLIDASLVEKAIQNNDSRDNLINDLRGIGMSLQDIGDIFNLTRERIRQLTKAGLISNHRRATPTKTIEEITVDIWKEALFDETWWNKSEVGQRGPHNLKRSRVILTIQHYGYTDAEATKLSPRVIKESIARMILIHSHGIPQDKHRDWIMSHRLANKTQLEICAIVNSKQPVKISIMTWNRYCVSLGFRELSGTQSKRWADELH